MLKNVISGTVGSSVPGQKPFSPSLMLITLGRQRSGLSSPDSLCKEQ